MKLQTMKALKNKRGFTLIEMIVVLVILAILVAAMIPSMLGFVEDSRAKAMAAEARTAYVAAQAVSSEEYASGTVDNDIVAGIQANDSTLSDTASSNIGARIGAKMNAMLRPDITLGSATTTVARLSGVNVDDGRVTALTYSKLLGSKTVTITIKPGEAATTTISK